MEKKKEDEKEKENDIIRFLNINIKAKEFIKFLKENDIKYKYKKQATYKDLNTILIKILKD